MSLPVKTALKDALLDTASELGVNLSDKEFKSALADLNRWLRRETQSGWVQTRDGSLTLIHEEYGEPYHSVTAGAVRECVDKFVKPSGILKKARELEEISILDIGFGLGYNVAIALTLLKEVNRNICVRIISLEKELPNKVPPLQGQFGNYHGRLLENPDQLRDESISFELMLGDARKTIGSIGNFKADVVFHDPFSPYRNPEMWTYDFLRCVKEYMKEEGVWVSYTSSLSVRSSLYELGFKVGSSEPVGRKRGGTVASLKATIKPLNKNEKQKLLNSPYACPMRDPHLNWDYLRILADYRLRVILRERELSSARRKGI